MRRNVQVAALGLFVLGVTTGCGRSSVPEAGAGGAEVEAIADTVWEHQLERELYNRLAYGLPVERLPEMSLDDQLGEAEFARSILDRLARLDLADLPHESYLTARTLRYELELTAEAPDFYWNMLSMSPYLSLYTWRTINGVFGGFVFEGEADLERYLRLLGDYARLLRQHLEKIAGQEERGVRLPRAALPGTVEMYEGFRDQFAARRELAADRLEAFDGAVRATFGDSVAERVDAVVAGYDAIIDRLSGDYRGLAPEAVSAAQFEGGREFYRHRARLFTTVDMEPEAIHQLGLDRVRQIDAEMAEIREQVGFEGSREEFHAQLRTDPRFLAETPEALGDLFIAHVGRMEGVVDRYFSLMPEAPYGVRRLTPAEEVNSTFGYYWPPEAGQPVGYYNYNASQLDQRSTVGAASLIFHELLPGHHFQVALQRENETLHPYRQNSFNSAFAEGWAEYASALGVEMGLYDDPYDHYGHLITEIFLASRLVVDTGIGYLEWPLERAREYMREHVFQSETEIATETLRYATRPGQALAYRLGSEKIWELRRRAEIELGESFDIRAFHATVLGSGTLPLEVLSEHVDWWIERQRSVGG